MNVRHKFYY